MKAPLSWLKEFVDIDLSITDLAHLLTMAGMEVEHIQVVGLPLPEPGSVDAQVIGYAWERDKIVAASISEVMPHPNADRLVLCKLFDGKEEHVVLTGAPNLFEYKGMGTLPKPLKVAYAKEGAQIYDGHQEGQVLTTLKRAKIRGVDSYSMVCSEKELGISEEHEGILFLEDDAIPGTPLADLLGDAVFDVKLLPSYARCASMLGLAREIAAMTGKPLKDKKVRSGGQSAEKGAFAAIEITNPDLNPRFVLGLIEGITIRPSPAWAQRRLKMAGMRPINNIVDATNYVMLEIGEPLHAFDHDVLQKRAGKKKVKIITRTATKGEKLTTLDNVERTLDESTVLVCDSAGALSMAGVMGGLESEVGEGTRRILLEGAAWNLINIRRTARAHALPSEASYRFSRGVHPAMAERGVRRGLELMHTWAGGIIADGLVDAYPLPPVATPVEISPADVERVLGISLSLKEMRSMLERLEFVCETKGRSLLVITPDHRLDIGSGVTGKADLVEEIARVVGYDNIPETRMADRLPPQVGNPRLDKEERARDLLVANGLQEMTSYRFTTAEREGRRLQPGTPPDDKPYVRIANPIAPDKTTLRHSVLGSVLEAAERNARARDRITLFEIGPCFFASEDPGGMPEEHQRIAIVMSGPRALPGWQTADTNPMDFHDLKGVLEGLLEGLRLPQVAYEPCEHPTFHPGKCARILSSGKQVGVFGEVHPEVRSRYDLPASFKTPLLAADIDLDTLLELMPAFRQTNPVPTLPPVLEDLAVVVDESIPADRVADLIRQAGGKVVTYVRLFDVYRGEKVGAGKKSLAYNITYQAVTKTFSDRDVAGMRARILKRLEQELGATLRT